MPLESGTKLGPYEIVSLIGDDQYKASDTRLNRVVVIKVLPHDFSENPEMKLRLERETHAIAALNHPNICKSVEVTQAGGTDFLVTEYLEGETLSERLKRGPLDLHEAVNVAIAIADALDKAHRHGVIHRSLNPSNIILASDGPKLLDFGVSTLNPSSAPPVSLSSLPTRTAAPEVLAAVPAFAAPYIAPERWEGTEDGPRSDIFAFGAILYEMVAGKPAFEGKTPALLIAAIETIDPEPLSKVQPLTPSALEFLVKRCLEKDPKQRLQTAWDLMSQLQWIAEGGSQIGVPAPVAALRRKQDRLAWIALAVVILLVLGMAPGTYHYFADSQEQSPVRFILPQLPNGTAGTPLSMSPDGRWIAISAGSPNRGLIAVSSDSVISQILIGDSVISQPFWSPNSRSVGFFDGGKLKKGDISGGPSQIVCDAPPPIGGGTWNSDGVILFASAGVIYRVLAAGGQPVAVTALDSSKQESEHIGPSFLPDGKHFLYLSIGTQPADSAIYVASIDSKERTRLFPSQSKAVYATPGFLLFNREGTVFAQPFDARKLALTGEAIRVADGVPNVTGGPNVSSSLQGTASYAVSQAGVLAFRTGPGAAGAGGRGGIADRLLTWIDRSGARTSTLGGPGPYVGVDLSPNGKQVAVHLHEANGGDSWYFDAAQTRIQRLTFDAAQDNSMPVWSPDNTKIAFASRRNGKWGLYAKLADGTAKEELLTESDLPKAPMSWTPDGKLLVYQLEAPKTGSDVWAVPVNGDHKPIPILQSQYNEQWPQVSTDGKWIAYASNETGRPEIYIQPFPEGPGKWQVSTDGGVVPRWRADGKELYFLQAPSVFAVDIHVTGSSVQPGAPHMLFGIGNPAPQNHQSPFLVYAVSPDGRRFLVPQPGAGPNLAGGLADQLTAAADQGGTAATGQNAITVVLNWPQILKRK